METTENTGTINLINMPNLAPGEVELTQEQTDKIKENIKAIFKTKKQRCLALATMLDGTQGVLRFPAGWYYLGALGRLDAIVG